MNKAMNAIKWELEEERKKKTLERAAMLTHLHSFKYYEKGASGIYDIEKDGSTELARTVIQCCLLESEYPLPDATLADSLSASVGTSRKQFRDKLKEQIEKLTKQEPSITLRSAGLLCT